MHGESALARLPHGPEFRFIDKLLELEPGKRGQGTYLVRGDEPFLKGHFPGNPIMPGVLLIEAAAQLGGVVGQSDPEHPPLDSLKLTAVSGAKILGSAKPGDLLEVSAHLQGRMGGLFQVSAEVRVNNVKILSATLTLSGDQPGPR